MPNQSKFESTRDFLNRNKLLVGVAAGALAVDAVIAMDVDLPYQDEVTTTVLQVVAPEVEVSVDPLGLDRRIEDGREAMQHDTTSHATEIPSFDEAPRKNRFLDGLTVNG